MSRTGRSLPRLVGGKVSAFQPASLLRSEGGVVASSSGDSGGVDGVTSGVTSGIASGIASEVTSGGGCGDMPSALSRRGRWGNMADGLVLLEELGRGASGCVRKVQARPCAHSKPSISHSS